MPDTVLVDGARPAVLSDDGTAVLFPTTAAGTWCFAEVTVPTARLERRPVLGVLRERRPAAGGAVTVGGSLSAQIDLLAPAPSPARIGAWTAQLRRLGEPPLVDDRYRFVPLSLRQGRMTLTAADGVLTDPPTMADVGGMTSVVATTTLSPAGADVVASTVTGGTGPPVGVDVDARYDLAVPECGYRVVADPTAVHAVFGHDPGALAGCLGQPVDPAAVAALLTALRPAVAIEWTLRPAGFDATATAAMETAIRQRWLGSAAVVLGARVVPGTTPADVTLPPLHDPDLALGVTHAGGRAVTAVLRRGADVARLTGLGPGFVADIALEEASLPVAVTFPPDDRVEQYLCELAYRAADGQTVRSSHAGAGPAGLAAGVVVRWPPDGPRPDLVTVRYTLLWAAPDWPATAGTVELRTDQPTLRRTIWPGRFVAEVAIATDFASAAVGALGSITWAAERPGGGSTGGSIVVEGKGVHGGTAVHPVAFPRAAPATFRWTAEVTLDDGSQLVGSGARPVTDAAEVSINLADLVSG